jgi:DNA-directed RNA polymerase specialized sigma24 family protein
VVGLAYALSGSRWGAEDLAQDAFLAAHRDWERIGSYEHPGAWVRRVVANLSVSMFRRRATEARALARVALGRGEPVGVISLGRVLLAEVLNGVSDAFRALLCIGSPLDRDDVAARASGSSSQITAACGSA